MNKALGYFSKGFVMCIEGVLVASVRGSVTNDVVASDDVFQHRRQSKYIWNGFNHTKRPANPFVLNPPG